MKKSDYHNPHQIYIELITTMNGAFYCAEEIQIKDTFLKDMVTQTVVVHFVMNYLGGDLLLLINIV